MAIIKSGKVVVMLAGRYAGKKAVVVKVNEDGTPGRTYAHALVAGIDRYPRKVTKAMGKAKTKKRTKIKPFVKYVNMRHIFPTRYNCDVEAKKIVTVDSMANGDSRTEARKAFKTALETKYMAQREIKSEKKAQGTRYLFKKLRF